MSQSPQKLAASKVYRDSWRAVNMLIRSDGSWSGRERKICYRNLGGGRFEEASFLSGLDLPEDGRSWVAMDLDGDGAQDLILSFRTGPRLRAFRNQTAQRAVTLELRGAGSNRDAVGAKAALTTDRRTMFRWVRSGSGFLSQSSRRLHFGLQEGEQPRTLVVDWPSGARESVEAPPIGLSTITEGGGAVPIAPTRPAPVKPSAVNPDPRSTWLVEPVPAPEAAKTTGTTLLAFSAAWCPPCVKEKAELSAATDALRTAGIAIRFVDVDLPANRDIVTAFSLLNRNLFDRRVDLALPTSFLIDGQHRVVRVFKGAVTVKDLLDNTPRPFPFDGKWYGSPPRRNWTEMATGFAEHGLNREAIRLLESAIKSGADDPLLRNNLAAALIESGDFPRAEGILKTQEPSPEALSNLGTAQLRQNRPREAIATFERALLLQPVDPLVYNGLGSAWFATGDLARAGKWFADAVKDDPGNADYRYNLGSALAQMGDLNAALHQFEQVRKMRGDSVDLLNNLGILYVESGRRAEGIACFEKALKLNPSHEGTKQNLARARSR